jgi:hypothetical protein
MDSKDPKDTPQVKSTLTPEAVQGVLSKLDKDLACQAVFSALSLKSAVFLESLVTVSDLMYFRSMAKVMAIPDSPDAPTSKNDLKPEEIRELLRADGWVC